jgi:hypothetical protein
VWGGFVLVCGGVFGVVVVGWGLCVVVGVWVGGLVCCGWGVLLCWVVGLWVGGCGWVFVGVGVLGVGLVFGWWVGMWCGGVVMFGCGVVEVLSGWGSVGVGWWTIVLCEVLVGWFGWLVGGGVVECGWG